MKIRIPPLFLHGILAVFSVGIGGAALAQPAWNPPSFSEFDVNGDGFISQEEFSEARGLRIRERAKQGRQMRGLATAPSFDSLDTDHDGRLSPDEFAAGQRAHQAQRMQRGGGPGGAGMRAGMGRNAPSFQDFDLNGDGLITADEFNQAHAKRMSERASAGFPMRGQVNAPKFEDIDADRNGTVTPAEFEAWRSQRRQQGRGRQ